MKNSLKAIAIASTAFLAACSDQQPASYGAAPQSRAAQPATPQKTQFAYVTVELSQSRFSLDPFDHLKDAMNKTSFSLPVSYDAFQKIQAGDVINNDFRLSSLLMKGSLSDWNFQVSDKPNLAEPEDKTAYRVRVRLKQGHFSLDPFEHLNDYANSVEFDWDIPGGVYDSINVGHDFISDGFRMGSFIINGSVGSWHLKVLEKKGQVPSAAVKAAPSPAP